MPVYSIIVPVYNRPHEVEELLQSMTLQSFAAFEVIIVEDGSTNNCSHVVEKYRTQLDIQYLVQKNTGPGPARNAGAAAAKGNVFIFLDSDVILPPSYLENVNQSLMTKPVECFGGPDTAHPSFTNIQKAISYAMTSPLTTGGIRGSKKGMDKFYPRSFNLGIQKEVFNSVNGFANMRFGEDLDLSMRLIENGFTTGLIPNAIVFHKRRTSFKSFYKQVFNSGIARINLEKRHPGTLKPVHILPTIFLLVNALLPLAILLKFYPWLWLLPAIFIFADAFMRTKKLKTALLSVQATYTQLWGYGAGFLKAYWYRMILGRDEFHSFKHNFYK